MKKIFPVLAILIAVIAIASDSALADRGSGSIRAASRSEPARAEPAHAEPARAEPARPEERGAPPHPAPPPRAVPEVRGQEHGAPPRVAAPARRDWDENDEDARHFGGFAHGVPVRIARGERLRELPGEHREVQFNNHRYFFDDVGICYDLLPDGEYVVIQPPIGVPAPMLAAGAVQVVFGPTTYYYVDGIFYIQQGDGYAVVNPPAGIVVPMLPTGAQQVVVNGNVAYQFNGFNYLPSLQDGVTVYTVMPA